jgi:hypothetical protein
MNSSVKSPFLARLVREQNESNNYPSIQKSASISSVEDSVDTAFSYNLKNTHSVSNTTKLNGKKEKEYANIVKKLSGCANLESNDDVKGVKKIQAVQHARDTVNSAPALATDNHSNEPTQSKKVLSINYQLNSNGSVVSNIATQTRRKTWNGITNVHSNDIFSDMSKLNSNNPVSSNTFLLADKNRAKFVQKGPESVNIYMGYQNLTMAKRQRKSCKQFTLIQTSI